MKPTGKTYQGQAFLQFMQKIIDLGGLVNYINRNNFGGLHGRRRIKKKFAAKKPVNFKVDPAEGTHVKKVIGVVSGKGGVGKSFVTAMSACAMNREGFKTAIMDADITGPSIPKMFGVSSVKQVNEKGLIIPASSSKGIEVMSVNLLLENETDPVVWRGPVISGTVKQFWTDVIWNDVDYMFVDMPPGTGDVPLTVFQSLPVDGIIIVTTPQDLIVDDSREGCKNG